MQYQENMRNGFNETYRQITFGAIIIGTHISINDTTEKTVIVGQQVILYVIKIKLLTYTQSVRIGRSTDLKASNQKILLTLNFISI